jgi:hypothetical protein
MDELIPPIIDEPEIKTDLPSENTSRNTSQESVNNNASKKTKKNKKLVLIEDDEEEKPKKINIYTNEEFLSAKAEADAFEQSEIASHYKALFCFKECHNECTTKSITEAFERIQPYISNSLEEILSNNKRRLCVLTKDHKGKCESEPNKIFIKTDPTAKKVISSIALCVYITPGDDDYVYKNRASRLFPIPLSKTLEKTIRNKEVKLRCAIPLCEYTTPFLMATAYIDWMCYTLSISDISAILNPSPIQQHQEFINLLLSTHKTYLENAFLKYNRRIFDQDGKTICAVKRNILLTRNMADISRDNRVLIDLDDIQMGHIESRSDQHFTIRGLNLTMMTREGNRIIGEDSFVENLWIEKLKKIVSCY